MNPWDQPFSASSPWNIGIGSNAQWGSKSDADVAQLDSARGFINGGDYSMPIYVGTASDPLVTITDDDGSVPPQTLHVPLDAVPAPGSDANMAFYDSTQPGKVWSYWDVTFNNGHDPSGGLTAGLGSVYDTGGDGFTPISYGPNQQDFDYVGGVINSYDLANGSINHMVRLALSDDLEKMAAGSTWDTGVPWPDTHVDYNAPSAYSGDIVAGSTFGIPASVDLNSLGLSQGGMMLAKALQQYGAIWKDSSGGPDQVTLYAQYGQGGNPLLAQMQQDMGKIIPELSILRNQGPNSVNGGGTSIASGQSSGQSGGASENTGSASGSGTTKTTTNPSNTTTKSSNTTTNSSNTTTNSSAPSAQSAASDSGSSSTVGSDTITLNLSEDRYLGDAQFIAKIDGVQIAGPTAVTALNSNGDTQTFTYNGNWGAGPHSIEVDFINDADGGTPQTDRNLYVNNITYDGSAALSGPQPLYSNGSFVVQVGQSH